MKKSTLLLLATAGWCGTLLAQPTLTYSGIMPVVGSSSTLNSCAWVSPGSAGANQTWNLPLSSTGTTTSTGVAPSSSPYASSFPSATVAFNSGGTWSFAKGTTSAWQNAGVVNGSGTVLAYSDMEDLLHFPFTYNNSYTDPWSVTYVQNTYTYYRWGTTTVTADGYGTLTTPDGTFANVTRVHFYQDYKDSTYIANMPFVIDYTNDEYMWYLNGNHNVVAAVYTFTTSLGSPVTAGYYMSGVVSGVDEQVPGLVSFGLTPNPATEQVNLSVNLTEAQEIGIHLYNSIGQEVNAPIINTGLMGDNTNSLSVAELPQGIYFVVLSLNGTRVSSRRLVVSH